MLVSPLVTVSSLYAPRLQYAMMTVSRARPHRRTKEKDGGGSRWTTAC